MECIPVFAPCSLRPVPDCAALDRVTKHPAALSTLPLCVCTVNYIHGLHPFSHSLRPSIFLLNSSAGTATAPGLKRRRYQSLNNLLDQLDLVRT